MRDSSAVLQRDGRRGFDAERLLAPQQAVVAFFARATLPPLVTEYVELDAASGRILATDAVAKGDIPADARSTMDGFAIKSGGATRRRIVGEIAMGHAPPRAIGPDEALRIPTGGVLPEGADAVVPLEDVEERDGEIELRAAVEPGDCFTPRGADMRSGEKALARGRRLGAPECGLLATLGVATVPVYKRPRFGIASTGDELVDAGATPGPGQIRDSNRYAQAAALRAMGVDAFHLPRSADDPEAMHRALAAALEECDGLVLTGGSSVGDRDFTVDVVRRLGEPGPLVHGIRVKPGKPTVLAMAGTKPILGLPGNPTSALTILEAVTRPIIAACTGERQAAPIVVDAIASEPFVGRKGWTWFIPARIIVRGPRLTATPLLIRSSHVSLPARASGYATLGEDCSRIEAGETVRIALYASGGAPFEVAG